MSKDDFMKKLEYLLSDIPEEDKADAIEYYRDYLEEAGTENEEQVIHDFGSPERIASIIRSEISGNLDEGGGFTDKGYEDERFKDPNYQMANRYDLPEIQEQQDDEKESSHDRQYSEGKSSSSNRIAKMILWGILIIAASPLILGIGGGFMGLLGGLFGVLVAIIVGLGALTLAFLVSGFAVLLAGFISIAVHPLAGLLVMGIGVVVLGFGLLGLAACVSFYGRFLPFLFRGTVNFIQSILNRRRSRL
ncbi:DUF1700 domain-containing protein [Lacrimispora sp.]|jgi:uncharacterized membrane protein|uniref:DUF1700 domain-containing protein n=1 Tax=Lacrimispora sp. TaxID=2719234 RepID=UPI0028AB8D2F|nr:DUF1700 domain-containing protein [Lacrimispora sp.]